jgi:pyruvate dehydrogenase E2 component (dihydrolipoamide acetyltransferase)
MAAEARIDLSALRGSGPNGRVVARDVEARGAAAPPASRANAALASLFDPASFDIVPHDARQRVRAEQVTAAKRSIPHFYIRRDVVLDPLLALLERVNTFDPALQIELRDCVVKALAIALTRVPDANVRWGDDQMLRFRQADIAIGTAAENTPVIRAANGKGLGAIAKEFAAAAESDAQHFYGVSAVWDMSASGVDTTAAIVRPPHVTALSIGTIEQRAVVREGQVVAESRSTLTLCCDHRAIDGVIGAELMTACVTLLERPMMLIL